VATRNVIHIKCFLNWSNILRRIVRVLNVVVTRGASHKINSETCEDVKSVFKFVSDFRVRVVILPNFRYFQHFAYKKKQKLGHFFNLLTNFRLLEPHHEGFTLPISNYRLF
jgi:hypothetical protein